MKNYFLTLLFIFSPLFLFSQNSLYLQNADFNNTQGWNSEGGYLSINNGRGYLSAGVATKLTQVLEVEEGYYDLTANVSISSCSGSCYLFGKGEGYTMASTEVPIVADVNNSVTVYVRGIATQSGTLEIGLYNEGNHDVYIDNVVLKKVSNPYTFLQGGDITELNYVLDNGGNYYNENNILLYNDDAQTAEKSQAVVNYLAERGMNFVRIRNSNNPGIDNPDNSQTYCLPDGYQDTEDCLNLAICAKNAGMKIEYTFNYSDYWSNGEIQNIPVDWQDSIAGLSNNDDIVRKLSSCISLYTLSVMKGLAEEGIYPEYVSLGNETNGGFLFPYGYSYDVTWDNVNMPQGSMNWNAIASFINAGYAAVKSVSPQSKVIVHLADNTGDYDKYGSTVNSYTYAWYFDKLVSVNAQFDVIGASYYPSWSLSTVSDLIEYCKNISSRYNKDILIMESGYNFNSTKKDGYNGQLSENASEYSSLYPFSEEGQKGFVTELLNGLKSIGSTSGHECLGSLYWDPVMIHVEDEWGNNKTGWANNVSSNQPDANVVENTTLFDFNGVALAAFEAYENNRYSELSSTSAFDMNDAANDSELSFYLDKNQSLHVYSTVDNQLYISDILGSLQIVNVYKEKESIIKLAAGVYIINGRKIFIR